MLTSFRAYERALASLVLGIVFLCGTAASAWATPDWLRKDPVVRAMVTELTRSMKRLVIPKYPKPYYIAYRIVQTAAIEMSATSGAIFKDQQSHKRKVAVDVRVGSYKADSSEDPDIDWSPDGTYVPSNVTTVEGSEKAIRHTLWLQTDVRYKQALSSYLKLKGQQVFKAKKRKRPSFSKAAVSIWADKPQTLQVDRKKWRERVKRLSAEISKDRTIFDAEVQASFQVVTRYFVNSEGTRLRVVQPMAAIHMSAYSRAPDGMVVDQSRDIYAPDVGRLPSMKKLMAAVKGLKADLAALRKAPLLAPYTGPAILEPRATGVFFHEVLGHRLEGHRQDMREEGQTFREHLGKTILPKFLSVYDDPTLRAFRGTPLNGFYRFDDEGVKARRVALVEKGVLRRFLMSRRPVEGFSGSNGHGRAQSTARPVARMGNLIVKADKTVSMKRLRQMLIEEVKRQKKPYGLIVRDITGGRTNTSSYGFQAFKGIARMVYTVDPKTGKETLVRGVDIVGTPLVSLGKIVAAGALDRVFNGYCGAESGLVPVSTVGPATLFREIELQRTGRSKTRGPILRAP